MSILQELLSLSESTDKITIQLDWDADADADTEAGLKANIEHALKDHRMSNTTYKIKTMNGPAAGCPVVQFTGPEAELKRFLDVVYGDDNLDLYKVNEAAKPKVEKKYKLITDRNGGLYGGRGTPRQPIEKIGTVAELIEYAKYTLEKGKSWEHEKGNKKINMNPKTIQQLVDNLNKAENNAASNGYSSTSYSYEEVKDEPVQEAFNKIDPSKYYVHYDSGKIIAGPLDLEGAKAKAKEYVDGGNKDVKYSLGSKLQESEQLEAEQLDEKVFDEEKYDWYVWTERRPSQMIERRGGSVQLERGRVFGVRRATSKKDGTYRLVLKSHGPSIIYSISERQALDLINAAAPAH